MVVKKETATTTKKVAATKTVKKEEVKVEEKVLVPEPEKEVKLTDSDLVEIMNNTFGRYGYISQTGYSITLDEYTDVTEIPFGELKKMLSGRSKRHIKDAFVIILNDQAVKQLNLTKEYEYILDQNKVEFLLKEPDLLEEVLPKMSKFMQESVIINAKNKFASGELYDNRVANAIKKATKADVLPQ